MENKNILDALSLEKIKEMVKKSKNYLIERGREKYMISGKIGKEINEKNRRNHEELLKYYKDRQLKEVN